MQVDDFEVQKEAAWCISNATCSSDPTHIEHLVQCNCLRPMVELLSKGDSRTSKVLWRAQQLVFEMLHLSRAAHAAPRSCSKPSATF